MKQNIKEIKDEIAWYQPPKDIAKAMLTLGKMGFRFSGHGCGMGGEDFGLAFDFSKRDPDDYLYVSICIPRKNCTIAYGDNLINTRTLPNTLKVAKKMIKTRKMEKRA